MTDVIAIIIRRSSLLIFRFRYQFNADAHAYDMELLRSSRLSSRTGCKFCLGHFTLFPLLHEIDSFHPLLRSVVPRRRKCWGIREGRQETESIFQPTLIFWPEITFPLRQSPKRVKQPFMLPVCRRSQSEDEFCERRMLSRCAITRRQPSLH